MINPRPIIYVDIDDTLVRSFGSKRIPISHMVDLVRDLNRNGATLYCWSSGGAEYARSSADALGLSACFTGYLPKPHLLLDDVAVADWKLGYLHPSECTSLSATEVFAKLPS